MMDTLELGRLLRVLYRETDEALRASFARSLPFQDGLMDRWERADRLGFEKGASIYNSSLVFGDVQVGAHTWIGPYTILDGSAGALTIGDYCQISAGVHIYTHHTVKWALSHGAVPKEHGPVSIGDGVYIGSQCVINFGVNIGDQSVVAANSYVNVDVPARTIVAGNPARPIGDVVGEGADVELVFRREHSSGEPRT